jgi:hypothetical protein
LLAQSSHPCFLYIFASFSTHWPSFQPRAFLSARLNVSFVFPVSRGELGNFSLTPTSSNIDLPRRKFEFLLTISYIVSCTSSEKASAHRRPVTDDLPFITLASGGMGSGASTSPLSCEGVSEGSVRTPLMRYPYS